MNTADLTKQKNLIRGVFYARYEGVSGLSGKIWKMENNFNNKVYGKTDYITYASKIADIIVENAYKNTDTNMSWIGMSYIPHVEKYHFRPLSYNLYDGVLGIALFYAAFYQLTGNTSYKNVCLKSIAEIRNIIHSYKIKELYFFVLENGIGGATGIGSMIYGLVNIAKMLKNPSLINDAEKLAELITPSIIFNDKHYDVIGGCAGAILGLVSLYRYRKSKLVYDKIILCSDHLVNNRIVTEIGNIKSWKGLWKKPLTGFSHGAAGISFALSRSYEINKNPEYLKALKEGLLYERSVFSDKNGNWPDFTGQRLEKEEQHYSNTWCHGAPGIALSRIGILPVLKNKIILAEIKIGLSTALSQELRSLDHLCCGNFGLIEIGLIGFEKFKEKEWSRQLNILIKKTIDRSLVKEQYKLFVDIPSGNFNPGFFRGLSGIGYQYLRLAFPGKLPSVLLWE